MLFSCSKKASFHKTPVVDQCFRRLPLVWIFLYSIAVCILDYQQVFSGNRVISAPQFVQTQSSVAV